MDQVKIYIFAAVFCFCFLELGFSETVVLKNGQKVEGKITEKTDKYVKLEFEGVVLVYYNDEIASIEQDTANNSGEVSPQLESLYKAYVSSLQAPKKPTPPVVTQKITKPTLQSTPEKIC